ncbi:hypothetical protein F5887DRAFT_179692 [Amanita rubescens]|nr:hypothetical protein F5887DRAFT_179692 [Amanita rubescens]
MFCVIQSFTIILKEGPKARFISIRVSIPILILVPIPIPTSRATPTSHSTGYPFPMPSGVPSDVPSNLDSPPRTPTLAPARTLAPDSVVPSFPIPIIPPAPGAEPSHHLSVPYSDATRMPEPSSSGGFTTSFHSRQQGRSRPRKLRKPSPMQHERQLRQWELRPMSMPEPIYGQHVPESRIVGSSDTRSIRSSENSSNEVHPRTAPRFPASYTDQIVQGIGDKGPWDWEQCSQALQEDSVPWTVTHSTPLAREVSYQDPVDRDPKRPNQEISDIIQTAAAPILSNRTAPGLSGPFVRQSMASTDLSEIVMLAEGPVSPLFTPLRLMSPESLFLRYSYVSNQDQQLPPSLLRVRSHKAKNKSRRRRNHQDAP